MEYAEIKNGVVVNVVVADESFATKQGFILLASEAGIGWTYVDGVFFAPVVVEEVP